MRHARMLLLGLLGLAAAVLAAGVSDGSTHYDQLMAEVAPLSRNSGQFQVLLNSQGERTSTLDSALPGVVAAKNPRLSSHLVRLAEAEREARAAGETIDALSLSRLDPDLQAMAELRLLRLSGRGEVQVYVSAATPVHEAAAAVEAKQGQVQRFDESAGIVQALVPIGRLEALAHQPSVKFIRLPDYGFPQAGSVTTQGDAILSAATTRSAFGVDGSGITVGVISDGVGGLAASQASGDLPAVNTATCNVAGSNPTLSGAEGTAMLEIVHDLAPGAGLWFGNFGFGTSLDFNAAVDCLAANTDVVVDDVGWFNVGPYDGTSIVSANTSTELNRTSNRIRAYANAVGNEADSHYQEPFANSGFDLDLGGDPLWDIHRFQATAGTSDAGNGLPCDFGQPSIVCTDSVLVPNGGVVVVNLQWDGAFDDYDLFVLDGTDGSLVTFSVNDQSVSGIPAEDVVWANNSGGERWFDIVIGRFAGSVRTFDMFVHCDCATQSNGAIHNFNTPASSVPNQSDAGGGVISGGAINASDPGNDTIAPYSSRGPTNDGRIKPDVTGIDCVTVTGVGGFGSPFCGTSAAGPHIAGIAALLLQCKPSLKAGEPGDNPSADRTALRNALLNNAVDLGSVGIDNTYGSGRADALASASATCDADSDGVLDVADNCQSVANGPAQAAVPGVGNQTNTDAANQTAGFRLGTGVPPPILAGDGFGDACDGDDDNDGFADADERAIYGVGPGSAQELTPCRTDVVVDPWPPDVFGPDSVVDIQDVLTTLGFVGTASGGPGYLVRMDPFEPGAVIDSQDVLLVLGFMGYSCSPPP